MKLDIFTIYAVYAAYLVAGVCCFLFGLEYWKHTIYVFDQPLATLTMHEIFLALVFPITFVSSCVSVGFTWSLRFSNFHLYTTGKIKIVASEHV